MKLEEIERRYEKWQCCCSSIGYETPPFNPHELMRRLLAVVKAAKNLNLENVPTGTYIDGMGHFYNALEELEKE